MPEIHAAPTLPEHVDPLECILPALGLRLGCLHRTPDSSSVSAAGMMSALPYLLASASPIFGPPSATSSE